MLQEILMLQEQSISILCGSNNQSTKFMRKIPSEVMVSKEAVSENIVEAVRDNEKSAWMTSQWQW
jgi:hypothetical protein